MDDFYEILNGRFGIMPPTELDQDWEFTCGDPLQTEEYISFYYEYAHSLRDDQKDVVINMIIQGFEDLFPELSQVKRDGIWKEIKEILTNENEVHAKTIKYWASLRTCLEDAFFVSGYMRELVKELSLEWNEVLTDADIEDLNYTYDYFEDSLIVSMNYLSGNSVSDELVGDMRGDNDLKITFQRLDRNPFSIELWFTHTRQMKFLFVNPSNNCQMDIMRAKVCRNNRSVFWIMWDEFDPEDEDHQRFNDVVFVESEGLRWRVIEG